MSLLLFGGSFDPIHNGHLFIAEAARRAAGVRRVIFLPTGRPHHREPAAAACTERVAMLRLAIAGNTAFALDESDLDDAASGYTADLLPRLALRYPGEAFSFLAGEDSLAYSPWQRFDEVLAGLERFLIAPRGEVRLDLREFLSAIPGHLRAKVVMLDLPLVPESASLIRSKLAAGRSARYLVPEPVWRYIETHSLYGTAADGS